MTDLSPTPSADAAAVGPRRSPKALALLDVLIGMAVFALIAVIAVIALGAYRERAFETGAQSDARSVGVALESNYVKAQGYPATMTSANLAAMNLTLTKNNRISEYQADHEGVSFCVSHYSGTNADAWARWDSQEGGVVSSGRGPSCAGGSSAGSNPDAPCPEIVSAVYSRVASDPTGRYPLAGYWVDVTFAEPSNTAYTYPYRQTAASTGRIWASSTWYSTTNPNTRLMRIDGGAEGENYTVQIGTQSNATGTRSKGCTQTIQVSLPTPYPAWNVKYPASVVTGAPYDF